MTGYDADQDKRTDADAAVTCPYCGDDAGGRGLRGHLDSCSAARAERVDATRQQTLGDVEEEQR